jgi:hypothetical protein
LGRFVKGDVVVVPFPFSDLAQAKRRPALVVAELEGDDRILCQITSRHFRRNAGLIPAISMAGYSPYLPMYSNTYGDHTCNLIWPKRSIG